MKPLGVYTLNSTLKNTCFDVSDLLQRVYFVIFARISMYLFIEWISKVLNILCETLFVIHERFGVEQLIKCNWFTLASFKDMYCIVTEE